MFSSSLVRGMLAEAAPELVVVVAPVVFSARSEERRVGKECRL